MATVIQNRWDSGQAEDVRTTSQFQNEKSLNFDIFSEPYRLNPYADSIADTADVAINDSEISDVGICTISGTDYIVGVGYESSGSQLTTFYTKTSVTGTFTKQATSAAGTSFVKGSGMTYKGLAYAVGDSGSGSYGVYRFNSAGSVTTVGTITATSGKPVKLFVHPEDNVLYIVVSNVISKWDNSSFTNYTSILPLNYSATSLTNYGGYLAITMNSDQNANKPTCFLWGRDGTLNTLQGVIPLGEGYVGIVENLDNNLIFIMSTYAGFNTTNMYKCMIKSYSGGAVETLKEIQTTSLNGLVTTYKARKNGRVYFGFANSDCIWTFGKNKDGRYTVTQDRYAINGTQISSQPSMGTLYGISIIGDIIWVGQASTTGTRTLMRSGIVSGEGLAYSATSTFRTTINTGMPIGDRGKRKKLKSVKIYYTGVTSGTIGVKYLVDGKNSSNTSTFESIISTSTTSIEAYTNATQLADNQAFADGIEYQFEITSVGGVKPKMLIYEYDVLND